MKQYAEMDGPSSDPTRLFLCSYAWTVGLHLSRSPSYSVALSFHVLLLMGRNGTRARGDGNVSAIPTLALFTFGTTVHWAVVGTEYFVVASSCQELYNWSHAIAHWSS